MGLLDASHMPRGIVAITTGLSDTAYVGDTETVVYTLPFVAAPKRIYKVQLRCGIADTDGAGDNATLRYAKNGLTAQCRWAAGTSITASSTSIGYIRATVFDDDSVTGTGIDASFFLLNPPSGQLAVGISIRAARAAATYGQVRFLTGPNAHLAVEDVGPYSE